MNQLFANSILALAALTAAPQPGSAQARCCAGHAGDATATATPDQANKVSITVDDRGFHPASIEIKKGQRVTLDFRRTSEETCATAVVFPELKLEKALPLNQTVSVTLPADFSSTLAFQCGMGMYRGKVVAR